MAFQTTFTAFNPATGEPLDPEYTDATSEEIDETVSNADSAFATYRKIDGRSRAEFLDRTAGFRLVD